MRVEAMMSDNNSRLAEAGFARVVCEKCGKVELWIPAESIETLRRKWGGIVCAACGQSGDVKQEGEEMKTLVT
jgi:hypothetical protein